MCGSSQLTEAYINPTLMRRQMGSANPLAQTHSLSVQRFAYGVRRRIRLRTSS